MSKKKTRGKNILADEETKPAYQSPAVVALGELARGSGKCAKGSTPNQQDPTCLIGNNG